MIIDEDGGGGDTDPTHGGAAQSCCGVGLCGFSCHVYCHNNILVSRPFIIRVSLKLLPSFISRLADQSPRFSKTLFG